MTTIVFTDKELIFDDFLLNDIPFFNSIQIHNFKESTEKRVHLNYDSKSFILMLGYKFSNIKTDISNEKNMLKLCDYLGMNNLTDKYCESHTLKYLLNNDIIDKKQYIIKLIIEKNKNIYFRSENQFRNFLSNPNNDDYEDYDNYGEYNNVMFYLVSEEYDLLNCAIDNDIFDYFDINEIMPYKHLSSNYDLNILMFLCSTLRNYSENINVLISNIEILLKHPKINVNIQNIYGDTALIYASNSLKYPYYIKITKLLLEHPDIDINSQNENYDCVLFNIIYGIISNYECIKLFKLLLEHPKININIQNKDGNTTLMLAIINDYDSIKKIELVKLLLEQPNIDVNIQNNKNYTALMLSFLNKYKTKNIIDMLLHNPNININLYEKEGHSALLLAIASNNILPTNKIEEIKLLLNCSDININLQNTKGQTALMILSGYMNNDRVDDMMELLLEHPFIDINLQDYNGNTALIYAIENVANKTINKLLNSSDVDMDIENNNGETSLMIAKKNIYNNSTKDIYDIILKYHNCKENNK
jgi:ankyrin repeat protein